VDKAWAGRVEKVLGEAPSNSHGTGLSGARVSAAALMVAGAARLAARDGVGKEENSTALLYARLGVTAR
jgi:hypothetical protein